MPRDPREQCLYMPKVLTRRRRRRRREEEKEEEGGRKRRRREEGRGGGGRKEEEEGGREGGGGRKEEEDEAGKVSTNMTWVAYHTLCCYYKLGWNTGFKQKRFILIPMDLPTFCLYNYFQYHSQPHKDR